MRPLISILLVTYQSEDDILNCLNSIKKFTHTSYEVLVLDTGSTDNSIQQIKSHDLYTSNILSLYIAKKNLGYAGGQQALSIKAKGKYLFFLNPDAEFTKDTVKPLVKILDSNDSAFCVQPAVYLKDQPDKLNLTGKLTHYLGFDYLRDYLKSTPPAFGEITSFSGSGVLCKADVFKYLGGFDTKFFMYYEDSDLSWRARLAGYRLFFVPSSTLIHDYKFKPKTHQQSFKNKLFYNERNRLMMVLKNYSLKSLILLSPMFIFTELLLLGYSILSGWFDRKCQALFSIWRMRARIIDSRSRVQTTRVVSDHQLVQSFVSSIQFVHFDHPVVKFVLNPVLRVYWLIIKNLI